MINEKKSTIDKIRYWLVWLSIPMCFYYTITDVINRGSFENMPVLVPICILLLCSVFFQQKGYKAGANWAYLIGAQAFMTYLIAISGGLNAPGIFWFSILPVVWATLLDKRGLIMGYSSILVIYLSFYVYEAKLPLPSHMLDPKFLFQARLENLIVFSTFVFVFLFIYTKILNQAQNEVEKKSSQVETLLRILVHDISNSLQVGHFQLEMMETQQKYDEKRNKKAIRSLDNINRMITDVRNMFAISQGKMSLNIGVASLKDAILSAIDFVEDKASGKNIKVIHNMNENDYDAEIDPSVFQNQIVTNILTNAIKFSEQGSEIRIDVEQDNNTWVVDITDGGMGIPDDILKTIFSPDVPTSRPGTDGEKGTGFGMPIVKQLMTQFNGSVNIISPPERHFESGTRVRLIVPMG